MMELCLTVMKVAEEKIELLTWRARQMMLLQLDLSWTCLLASVHDVSQGNQSPMKLASVVHRLLVWEIGD